MTLDRLIFALDSFEMISIILIEGYKTTILFSGGANDYRGDGWKYEVIRLQKEMDASYTVLVSYIGSKY